MKSVIIIADLLEAAGEFNAEVVDTALKIMATHPTLTSVQAMRQAFKQVFANAPEMWVYAEE